MTKYPSGKLIDVGDLELNLACVGMLIESERDALNGSKMELFQRCVVIPKSCVFEGVVIGFNTAARTVTLRFDEMPIVATGEKVMVAR